MHNKVVFQAAKSLHGLGLSVLRFNFRGAGLSEGAHDRGRGEQDDVRAALEFLAEEFPALPIVLAGFSFGAVVGLEVGCGDHRVTRLVALGVPVNDNDVSYLTRCAKPKLFVQGTRDQFGARDRLESLFAAVPEPKRLVLVNDADHFFTGKLNQVDGAITRWMKEALPGS
jgi:alpha/beta superfamily hydrolase